MTRHRCILGTLLALAFAATTAAGQGIYRWTDDHGVVHFGNSPPHDKNAVEQKLPPKRARQVADDTDIVDDNDAPDNDTPDSDDTGETTSDDLGDGAKARQADSPAGTA